MLLKQQEQAKYVKAHASLDIEVQNPTPMTPRQRQWESEECLPHYFMLRKSKYMEGVSSRGANIPFVKLQYKEYTFCANIPLIEFFLGVPIYLDKFDPLHLTDI